MRVFVTGASGWIGSAVIPELMAAGHEVVGLARNDGSAAKVTGLGVEVLRGDLDDLDSLRAGAEASDAVIHLAFKHEFSDYAASGVSERAAVETIGGALEGTDKPFLFASGLAGGAPGILMTENDETTHQSADSPRGGSEFLALGFAERGVRAVGLRFSATVHGEGDHGFTATLAGIAREKGVAGYVGDGSSRWPAVHRLDAASMVRLALEKAAAGSVVHGVAEEGIPTRDIAEALGRAIGVEAVSVAPADAMEHFGWLGMFFGLDIPASSAITRELLGWTPTHATLLEDIAAGYYLGQ